MMQDVFNLLNEYGLLFNEMEEINRFTELYTQMNENCRKWELRGTFPEALKRADLPNFTHPVAQDSSIY